MDGTGNPVGMLTSFNTNAFGYAYDPYGTAHLTSGGGGGGTNQNPYLFKGGLQDRGSGLVKFGQRWYDPTTGRWTQQDTLDAPLDPANANRYAFAGDDPINGNDPSGLSLPASTICGGVFLLTGIIFDAGVAAAGFSAGTSFVVGAVIDIGLFIGAQLTC